MAIFFSAVAQLLTFELVVSACGNAFGYPHGIHPDAEGLCYIADPIATTQARDRQSFFHVAMPGEHIEEAPNPLSHLHLIIPWPKPTISVPTKRALA